MGERTNDIFKCHWRIDEAAIFFLTYFLALFILLWNRFVSDIICPSVQWNSPRAVALNTQVIDASDKPEISFFSPISSPRISYMPELNAILLSPTSHSYIMIKTFFSSFINKYTACIVIKLANDSNLTRNRPTMVNLIHHGEFSTFLLSYDPVLGNRINFSISLSWAACWRTVSTFQKRWAF